MIAPARNEKIVLARHPTGLPIAEDFAFSHEDLAPLADGQVRVRLLMLGLEPSARPRMNAVSPYSQPIGIGGVVSGTGIGEVIESRSSFHGPGDMVFVHSGWQRYFTCDGADARRIFVDRAPLAQWLGVLGLSSFTAWVGMTQIAPPNAGETVVVSAAAGATGAIAGQIAGILGARAVGIAGGADKCRHVESMGFDACVDYKSPTFLAALHEACPTGIDVDYENVGGAVLDAIIPRMNRYGRVILCGLVSEYSKPVAPPGPNLWPAVYHALRIEGFLASRYFDRLPIFVEQALAWIEEGRLRQVERIVDGLENVPAAFNDLLTGKHFGKAIVRIADPG